MAATEVPVRTDAMAHTPVHGPALPRRACVFPATLAVTAASAERATRWPRQRRTSCVSGSVCSQVPSVNLVYDDVWTDPAPGAANRAADASLSYTYGTAGGFNTTPPVRTSCMSAWSSTCRIIVNYEQHIHPLWSLPRGAGGVNACTSCHTPADDANLARLPAGQLDLSGTPSTEQQLHMTAYRELVFGDSEQELVGGALQDRLVPGPVDPARVCRRWFRFRLQGPSLHRVPTAPRASSTDLRLSAAPSIIGAS